MGILKNSFKIVKITGPSSRLKQPTLLCLDIFVQRVEIQVDCEVDVPARLGAS